MTADEPACGCNRCGQRAPLSWRDRVRICDTCTAERRRDGTFPTREADLDAIAADLVDLPARWPGLAARLGVTWAAPRTARHPGTPGRWEHLDADALTAAARRILPAAAWHARPTWAEHPEPEEVTGR